MDEDEYWDVNQRAWVRPQSFDEVFADIGPASSLEQKVPEDGDVVIKLGRDGAMLVKRLGDKPRADRRSLRDRAKMTGTEVARMSTFESAQEELRTALVRFAGLQALMDRFQGQEPPVGSVLRWAKQFDARRGELVMERAADQDPLSAALRFKVEAPSEYVFVAFRAPNGQWYTTSQRGRNVCAWDELMKDIGDAPCELASEWTEVPAPAKVEESQLDPTEWARQMFGKKDSTVDAEKSTD